MSKYFSIIIQEAARWGVPPAWISAIIQTESGANPNSIGRGDCARGECSYGLMGLMLSTARGLDPSVTIQELMTPEKNIEIGAMYLAQLRRRFSSPEDVFAYYKGGHPWATSSAQAKKEALQAMRAAGQSTVELATGKYGNFASSTGAGMLSGVPKGVLYIAGLLALIALLRG